MIAVDRVLFNCFCTKMEFMLQINAVTTYEPLYACVKVDGSSFYDWAIIGLQFGVQNNHRKVLNIVFFTLLDPLNCPVFYLQTPSSPTFMSFLLCNMLNMNLQIQNSVLKVKFYSIHIVCVCVCA